MSEGWMITLILLMMVPIVLITTIMPYLTRKIECFGVTIPAEAQSDPDIIQYKKQYIVLNTLLGIVTTVSLIVCSLNINSEKTWSLLLVVHLLAFMLLSFFNFIKQHYAVKRLKESRNWLTQSAKRIIVDTNFRRRKLTVSYVWFLPHFLLIAGTALISVLGYDKFPEQIAMKFDFSGKVIRTAAKSWGTVLWPVVAQASMLILFFFIQIVISRSKQLIESSDPENSLQRNIIFRRRWSAFMMIASFLFMALFLFIQLSAMYTWTGTVVTIVPLAFIGIFLIGTIALSVSTGQGGSRIKTDGNAAASSSTAEADHDQYWKLGTFYFNPNDPAIFVEKRFGTGWTMNCARPSAWIILIAIIAIPVLLTLLLS